MKHKRLNRDGWGFQYYPYYQMRIDHELFHGTACLIRFTDGEDNCWQMPEAGRIRVTGSGMTWLELIPDGMNRVITVMYFPDGMHDAERNRYPVPVDVRYQPSLWYIDITEGTETGEDGILVYIDKYLDVILTPEGDVKIDDRDELDAAYAAGELTKAQYDAALEECERVLREYAADIRKTDAWCAAVRQLAEERIAAGEPVTICREVRKMKEITGFLIRAKRATYAGKGAETDPSRPGSHDLVFREDEYMYYDTYLGGDRFAGEEALWIREVPFWSMNYAGRVTGENFSGDFLKEALLHVPEEEPYRGPREYAEGGYVYRCEITGDFSWFQGRETIGYRGEQIYECVFHGGLIK